MGVHKIKAIICCFNDKETIVTTEALLIKGVNMVFATPIRFAVLKQYANKDTNRAYFKCSERALLGIQSMNAFKIKALTDHYKPWIKADLSADDEALLH